MKYKLLTEDSIKLSDGTRLYRVQALKDFGDVKQGDTGGYIESKDNLSQRGNCWVYDSARVFGSARVSGNAQVFGDAQVSGSVLVYGDAWVYGSAHVYDSAQVLGNALVYSNAQVSGNAWVYGNAWVSGDALVSDSARVSGDARVFGNAQVSGDARVYDSAWVYGNARVKYTVPTLSGLPKHRITVLHDRINIGCESHSIEHWIANGKEIADRHDYSEKDRNTYMDCLKLCKLLQGGLINNEL